jgi:hypothetical protein
MSILLLLLYLIKDWILNQFNTVRYLSFGRKTRLTDLKKFGLTDLRTNEPSDFRTNEPSEYWLDLRTIEQSPNKLGFGHLNFHTNNIAFYLTNIKQRIHDHAIQNLNYSIRECSKLEFFQNVFKINERPAYTDIWRRARCCVTKR